MSQQAGRYQRSFGGLIGSLVVLVLVVLGVVVVRDLDRSHTPDPVQPKDWRTALGFARQESPFPVLAPTRLPDGWIATSVRFDRGRAPAWHLGMLTGDRHYVGLEQARRGVDHMVSTYVDEQAEQGRGVRVGGETWQSWSDSGGDHALTRRADGVTTLVVGSVSQDDLVDFVGRLS